MADWCRCKTLGKKNPDWSCPKCGGQRRYHERLSIARGGMVGVCGECRYKTEWKGEKQTPKLVRFVTSTTALAGEHRDTVTYLMCDPCIDAEIIRQKDADISDNRELVSARPVPALAIRRDGEKA